VTRASEPTESKQPSHGGPCRPRVGLPGRSRQAKSLRSRPRLFRTARLGKGAAVEAMENGHPLLLPPDSDHPDEQMVWEAKDDRGRDLEIIRHRTPWTASPTL
jgi:hypothetical protein